MTYLFREPPPDTRGRPRVITDHLIQELEARAGKWVFLGLRYSSQASKWKKEFPDLEFKMRRLDSKMKGEMYVRWVGKDSLL